MGVLTTIITALKDDKIRQTIRDIGVVILFGLYMWFNHTEKMQAMDGEAHNMVGILERQTDAIEVMVETYTGNKIPNRE